MSNLLKDANSVNVSGGVSDLDGITPLPFQINHTNGRVMLSATIASGGGLNSETPTGAVNGVNTVYTTTRTVKYVLSDGMIRKEGIDYTFTLGSPNTITMNIAPQLWIDDLY